MQKEEIDKLLLQQKKCLQYVLMKSRYSDAPTLSNATSNYANLLSKLGRNIEAIDYCYDCLKEYPNHAIAMCNASSALQKLVNISIKQNPKILYEAWILMKKASKLEKELVELAGDEMIARCRSALKNFEEHLDSLYPDGKNGLESWVIGFEEIHTWNLSTFLENLRNDRLLLTVNPRIKNCPSDYKDDICFESIITPLTDDGECLFQKIVATFNNIKEDFSTSRYLYYQSKSQDVDLINTSSITWYLETSDSSDYGLRSGFLKTSFRLAADLFDKCAGFLNLYLNLDHPENEVVMNNFWYLNRSYKKGVHPKISACLNTNLYLKALQNLNQDLYLGEYPAPIKDLRNEATHKRLTLSLYDSFDIGLNSYSVDDFQQITKFLLRLAKAAIIYIVGVVMIEEQHRQTQRENNGEADSVANLGSYYMDPGLSDKILVETSDDFTKTLKAKKSANKNRKTSGS